MPQSYDAVFVILAVVAVLIIVLAIVGAVIDRSVQGRSAFTRQLAEQTVELGRSELQYRLLFDHNPNPMWVYAKSTKAFLAVNEAAVLRYGYSKDEFLSMSLNDVWESSEEASIDPATSSAGDGDLEKAWNGRHRKKDGTLLDVAVTSQEIMFDGREAFLALALDVTHARLAEEALRQNEQRTRLIIDTSLDAVITMDADGRVSDWNIQAERMFGWSRSEAIGQHLAETVIPLRYRTAHQKGIEKFLATGVGPVLNRRIEITAQRRDGEEFPIELSISPARLGGEWTFSAFIRDLTEQKQAAEAVRLGEKRYRELFEDIPVGVYRSTPEGRLIDANPAMVSMFGCTDLQSLLATPTTELYVDPEDRVRWTAEMTRADVVRDFDVRLRRGDGSEFWARDTTHAKRESDGRVLLYEGVIEDITEKRSLEDQLRQTSKMEAVGQLAGGVAHDFNNLLTVIMSYGAMLLDRIHPDDPNHADVYEITTAAERAAALTRQLLAFSRKQVMQPRVIDINTVVAEVDNMLRRLIGEHIEFRMDLAPGVAMINADPGQLQQVLMNLVVNARDAMPRGGRLTIVTSDSTRAPESDADAPGMSSTRYVVLSVSDTGTGMTPDVQRRIFDPFFTTKENSRGTGLGLSTVYGIVKQSGGEICVDSELDMGTTFRVYFPALQQGNVAEAARPSRFPSGSETILLVEDDAHLRALAERVLKGCGYHVLAAGDGAGALELASDRAIHIHAVVSDIVMPGMNGRTLVETLLRSRKGIKSLLMSGYTDDAMVREDVSRGDTAFLQKPFSAEDLAVKVRAVLDNAT